MRQLLTLICLLGAAASAETLTVKPDNVLTGPFFIEGAEPGDTIAVRLDKVRLNRDPAAALN